ncbi:serine/threonine-protein kinase [Streptomyces sp. NPDC087440]|uniref:serine/threonine-protein kinase n=1 Tax=Streptomyces sp. NPDC087440 TaxID=3365790 RepID=UPI00381CDF80
MESLRPRQDPDRIGSYTLLARLGAGGMGQVYLGRSPGGRLVAIKVIRDEITDHPEALARFRREANTVRAVRSAYTANLMEASLDAAPYWLATEYVSGPTLARAVRERGAFPADTARGLCAALAEGLASVHAYDVTHRDLKPMNVILAGQGPQLIDFGIARGVGDTALTVTGTAPGTPGFTAPEVLIRNQVGPEADVFALGATLAYAVTGRPPFGSGPSDAVSYRAVHEPVDLDGVGDTGLVELIRACVAKDPADRPTPEDVIRGCGVRGALVDDPFYGEVVRGLAESVPVAPDVLHELPTHGPGLGYIPTLDAAPLGPGTTPGRGAAARRLRPWAVAAAVGAVVGVSVAGVLLLPGWGEKGAEGAGGGGGGQTVAGKTPGAQQPQKSPKSPEGGTPQGDAPKESPKAPPKGSPKEDVPKGPPSYVEQTAPAANLWNGLRDRCALPAEETYPLDFQGSIPRGSAQEDVGPGKVRIGFRLKNAITDAPPYYVSIAVKPIMKAGGDRGIGEDNTALGYLTRPVNLHEGDSTAWKDFTYPDDFTARVNGKAVPAAPLSSYTGEWTVNYLHVTGVREYRSFFCSGFMYPLE